MNAEKPRLYVPWTREADEFIADLHVNSRHLTIPQITVLLNAEMHPVRTFKAVNARLRHLGLSDRAAPEWPEARIEKLRTLWAADDTATQIAEKLGVSRSAVLGKVHRLGLASRAPRGNRTTIVRTRKPAYQPVAPRRDRTTGPKVFTAPSKRPGDSKTSPAYRNQLGVAPEMTSWQRRNFLAEVMRNTAALPIVEMAQ